MLALQQPQQPSSASTSVCADIIDTSAGGFASMIRSPSIRINLASCAQQDATSFDWSDFPVLQETYLSRSQQYATSPALTTSSTTTTTTTATSNTPVGGYAYAFDKIERSGSTSSSSFHFFDEKKSASSHASHQHYYPTTRTPPTCQYPSRKSFVEKQQQQQQQQQQRTTTTAAVSRRRPLPPSPSVKPTRPAMKAIPNDEQQQQRPTKSNKTVSFADTVEVRYHPIILGDHPCCSSGFAIELDWDCCASDNLPMKRHDTVPQSKRRVNEFRMNYAQRRDRLCSSLGMNGAQLLQQEYELMCTNFANHATL